MNSVKILSANKEKVFEEIREYAVRLKHKFPQLLKIILFGSYAKNNYLPQSDVDLLIVLKNSDKRRIIDRIPDFLPTGISTGADIFPYTVDEIEKMKKNGSFFINRVLKEGLEVSLN